MLEAGSRAGSKIKKYPKIQIQIRITKRKCLQEWPFKKYKNIYHFTFYLSGIFPCLQPVPSWLVSLKYFAAVRIFQVYLLCRTCFRIGYTAIRLYQTHAQISYLDTFGYVYIGIYVFNNPDVV